MQNLTVTRLVVGALSANCFIIDDGKATMIIDPGGNPEHIVGAIRESHGNVEIIVLTHGHSDHIAALYEIREATGAEVAVHSADADFMEGRGPYSSQFGISYRTPRPPERLLEDGDIVPLGNRSFTVIHTPGHTPGSICLLEKESGLLFSGDTLLRHSIGTTMMPGSSRSRLIESIRTRLLVLPDDTRVFPGHGRETSIGEERRLNRYVRQLAA